jgi:hypothetical protein
MRRAPASDSAELSLFIVSADLLADLARRQADGLQESSQ